jgi:hypothetical protein
MANSHQRDYTETTNEDNFQAMMSYHPARPELDQPQRYSILRESFMDLCRLINKMCPEGKAKQECFTTLEVALMRATQAIAVGEGEL